MSFVLAFPAAGGAQDVSPTVASAPSAELLLADATAVIPPSGVSVAAAEPQIALPPFAPRRPTSLVPMYVSFAALQVADAATTFRALDRGATEANPLLGSAADTRGALLAVKAASSVAVIYASEKLWRRNRVAAVALMAAVNGAYALVVAHNHAAVR